MARKLDPSAKMLFIGEVVADALRARAPHLAELLDLDSIEALPTEYIDQRTRGKRFGDAAFRVRFRKGRFPAVASGKARGRRLYLIVAVEFQHRSDAGMGGRVREYAEWQDGHYRQLGVVRNGEHPPLLALVIHTGPDRWTAEDGTETLRVLPRRAARLLVRWQRQAYILIDAGPRSRLSLPGHNRIGAVIRLARCATIEELAAQLVEEWQRFGGHENLRFRRGLWAWAKESGPAQPGTRLPSFEELEATKEEPRMPNVLAARIRELVDNEIEQGRARGMEQGIEQGQRETLELLASRRFGADAARGLSLALNGTPSREKVAELGDLILHCQSAQEFLSRLND